MENKHPETPGPTFTEERIGIPTHEMDSLAATAEHEYAGVTNIESTFPASGELDSSFFNKRTEQLKNGYEIAKGFLSKIKEKIGDKYRIKVDGVTLSPLETVRANIDVPFKIDLLYGQASWEDSNYVQSVVAARGEKLRPTEAAGAFAYELLTLSAVRMLGAMIIADVSEGLKGDNSKALNSKMNSWMDRQDAWENNPVIKKHKKPRERKEVTF